MGDYSYKATTRDGKIVEGTLTASSQKEVLLKLQEFGYIPIRVAEGDVEEGQGFTLFGEKRKVKTKDLLMFTRELNTLLVAGLPLDRSLMILQDLAGNPAFHEIIRDVIRRIKGGKSLSEAMADYPKVFPKVYVNMVKAGEMGGVLPEVLEEVAGFLERTEEMRSFIVSSLIYPAVIFCSMTGSILVMILFVIPRFSQVFENSGAAMPTPMAILLGISGFVQTWWWAMLGAGFLAVLGFRQWKATEEGKLTLDQQLIQLPILGTIINRVEVSRLSRTLGTLLHNAVPMITALSLVREVVENRVIADSIEPIKAGVKKGEGLVTPMKRTGLFPPLSLHLLEVGEETGNLSGMLVKVADIYEAEVKVELKRLITLLEPAMILFMGAIVGLVVISMVFSIFSISEIPG